MVTLLAEKIKSIVIDASTILWFSTIMNEQLKSDLKSLNHNNNNANYLGIALIVAYLMIQNKFE